MLKISVEQLLNLRKAGKLNREQQTKPLSVLYSPPRAGGNGFIWLVTHIEQDGHTAFGLADLKAGFPELGYFDLNEIDAVSLPVYAFKLEGEVEDLQEYADIASKKRSLEIDDVPVADKIKLHPLISTPKGLH